MIKKLRSKMNELSIRTWMLYRDIRGGVLVENKIMMILGVVILFGVGALAIKWITNYWEVTSTSIQEGGQIDGNFGSGVNFGN